MYKKIYSEEIYKFGDSGKFRSEEGRVGNKV